MGLVDIADELYGVRPDEFVAARRSRASAEREAGNGALAREILDLSKPSAAASFINLLARDRSAQLHALVEVGESLRAAQTEHDRRRITSLDTRRRGVLDATIRAAGDLADRVGRRFSDAVAGEVRATLQAALVDPDAAAAVISGRLIRALTSNGFDPVDLNAAVAVPDELPVRQEESGASSTHAQASVDDIRAAARRNEEAAHRTERARATLAAIDENLERLSRESREARERLEALEDETADLKRQLSENNEQTRALNHERKRAAREVSDAELKQDRAQALLGELDNDELDNDELDSDEPDN